MADGPLSPDAQERLDKAIAREKSNKPRLDESSWLPAGSKKGQIQADDRALPTRAMKAAEEKAYLGLSDELLEQRRQAAVQAGKADIEYASGPKKKKQSWISKLLWGKEE